MDIAQNKWIRFLFLEPSARRKLFILVVLIGVIVYLKAEVKKHELILIKAKAESALVNQIAEMESKVRYRETEISVTPEEIKEDKADLILEGLYMEDGVAFALINGKVYKSGDRVNGSLITAISLEKVGLESLETKEPRNLYLKKKF